MNLSEEISTETAKLQFKVMHLFTSIYPPVNWDVWKTQVLEGRDVLNPHRRYGMLWFHIPSLCKALKSLDYDTYQWLNVHSPFFKHFLVIKAVCVDHRKTVSIRGIQELKFNALLKHHEVFLGAK